MKKNNIELMWLMRLSIVTVLLFSAVANSSLFTFHSSLLRAQEIAVRVTPVQQVLPPQAGQYVDNPGKFFTVTLTNLTDDEQRLHIGMNIDMLFPTPQSMVVTPTDNRHIPRQPIVVAPRQTKILNPVEMKQLFNHFNLNEIYIRDGMYNDYKRGIFGLLPEGQYKLFLHAYKWDPNLTSVVKLNSQDNGDCQFTVCYEAQAPQFLTPTNIGMFDAASLLSVAKLDKNMPVITWTQPTLNCNPRLLTFEYNVKIVRLDGLHFDDAMDNCPVVYQRNRLTTTTLTLPVPYVQQMMKDKTAIYAIQVTATQGNSLRQQAGNLNFTLIENDGRSPVMLFRLYDPTEDLGNTTKGGETPEGTEKPEGTEGGDGKTVAIGDDGEDAKDKDSLYVFEQPILISPRFPGGATRKIFEENDIPAEWRKAWFSKGKGGKQDTVKFEYTLALYKGNSADDTETIFKYKPIFQLKTEELKDTIRWKNIADKVKQGDYLILRVTAEPTNAKSIRMLPDSLNYRDFTLAEEFDEETSPMAFRCGTTTDLVKNKTPLVDEKAFKAGTELQINSWRLQLNGDVKQDEKKKYISGTGWIVNWTPATGAKVRVAVKFDSLFVNTDKVVYAGTCRSYPLSQKNASGENDTQSAVDKLFSTWGLSNYWGEKDIPADTKAKVTDTESNVAKELDFSQYYQSIKIEGNRVWDGIKAGSMTDLYFPTQLPSWLCEKLPKDMAVQIASVQVSPKGMVMNLVAEFAMPKSDIIKNDILIFGAPRLCVQPDRLLPEDGVLSLISNFTLMDPDTQYEFTFKAPADPLQPQDGCFLSWENDEFSALSIHAAMKIPNLRRVIDGEATDEMPIIDLRATIEDSWSNWMGKITMDPFEFEDAEGWYFKPAGEIVFDHNYDENDVSMPDIKKMPDTYDPARVNPYAKNDWKAWMGMYMKEFYIQFPQWECFGNGETGFETTVKDMFIDNSGFTLDVGLDNIFNEGTTKAGGWQFALDSAFVKIVQNNFNDFHLTGRFRVPLFGEREKDDGGSNPSGPSSPSSPSKSNKNDDEDGGMVHFTCDIRHITDPEEVEYPLYDKDGNKAGTYKRKRYAKNSRMAYIFKTTQLKRLNLDCLIADLSLDSLQTYFVVAAEEQENGKTKTNVELSMGGDITIANVNSVNDRLAKISKNLPLELKLPGIHFVKMRLANFKRGDKEAEELINKYAGDLIAKRDEAQNTYKERVHNWKTLRESKEITINENCYLDWGEWSFSSDQKALGIFKFNIKKFDFDYDTAEQQMKLGVEGELGLCQDLINVSTGVEITSKLTYTDIVDLHTYHFSDGEVKFKSIGMDLDFSVMKLEGRLDVNPTGSTDKGYAGKLKLDVSGLFSVDCKGGYFEHQPDQKSNDKQLEMLKGAELEAFKKMAAADKKYSWGYFTCEMKTAAGIRADPLVVNRIAGGIYFNSRPQAKKDDWGRTIYGDPVGEYGCIGVSFGLGICSSAGEHVVQGDVDLNVVYNYETKLLTSMLFKGKVTVLDGVASAEMTLLYENSPKEEYMELDLSLEAGIDTKAVAAKFTEANEELKKMKKSFDDFQADLPQKVKDFAANPKGSFNNGPLSDGEMAEGGATVDAESTATIDEEQKKHAEENKPTFSKLVINFQLKYTWRDNYVDLATPLWHVYLGQPAKDKRCSYTLLDYSGLLVTAKIYADGYLCIGNELPDNGKLPPIPEEITNFIKGDEDVDCDGDMDKAENSRSNAVKKMLGNKISGGVMVGISGYGHINVDLGLFNADLLAIGGFDMAMVHYENNPVCTNLHQSMGYNGWYANGQFYAYLAARFGLHIKLGKLIDRKIDILNAGIGGVFEAGLPHPTWIEGKARVKVSLLGGLVDVNRKFTFECGDYCEAFLGNALDDFEFFRECNIGADEAGIERRKRDYKNDPWEDKIYEGVDTREWGPVMTPQALASAYVNTTPSLGSQYRLVDPSTAHHEAEKSGTDEEKMKLQAARTYVFNFDQESNANIGAGCIKGARLFKITDEMLEGSYGTPEGAGNILESGYYNKYYNCADVIRRMHGRYEDSDYMNGSDLSSSVRLADTTHVFLKGYERRQKASGVGKYGQYDQRVLSSKETNTYRTYYLNVDKLMDDLSQKAKAEKPVTIRESKGNRFHVNLQGLEPGHYMLVLSGTAYEVEGGVRVWPEMVVSTRKGGQEFVRQHWRQRKFCYFTVPDEDEVLKQVEVDDYGIPPEGLQPYVAAAIPSAENAKLFNTMDDGDLARLNDVLCPSIALNTNISETAYQNGDLYWQLEVRQKGEEKWYANYLQIIPNKWVVNKGDANKGEVYSVTMMPEKAFENKVPPVYNYGDLEYHLELRYKYNMTARDSKNDVYKEYDERYESHEPLHPGRPNFGEGKRTDWNVVKAFMFDKGNKKDFENYLRDNGWPMEIGTDPYKFDNPGYFLFFYLMYNKWLTENPQKAHYEEWLNTPGRYVSDKNKAYVKKDTVINLADWYFKGVPARHWLNVATAGEEWGTNKVQYELPFIGVQAAGAPQYTYDKNRPNYYVNNIYGQKTSIACEESEVFQTKDNLRLLDPYFYFAYLSNKVFIGGQATKAYAFDKAATRHATETLTFSFNGVDVQGSYFIKDMGINTLELRDKMYGAWNSWYYNDGRLTRWPLPAGKGDAYDVTIGQQDGKATKYWANHYHPVPDYSFHRATKYFYKQFVAPYFIAQKLSEEMKTVADDLYECYSSAIWLANKAYDNEVNRVWEARIRFYQEYKFYVGPTPPPAGYEQLDGILYGKRVATLSDEQVLALKTAGMYFPRDYAKEVKKTISEQLDDLIDQTVRQWNELHRGQYLSISSEGYEVRVPYYQFPLIFGDCFGKGSPMVDPNIIGFLGDNTIKRGSRSFSSSLSKSLTGTRFDTEMSNIMFFRLRGGFPFSTYPRGGRYSYDSNYTYKPAYYAPSAAYVNYDKFDAKKALECLTSLPMLFYRVNEYDINTGLFAPNHKLTGEDRTNMLNSPYYCNPLVDDKSVVRGKPLDWLWESDITNGPKVTVNSSMPDIDRYDSEEKK